MRDVILAPPQNKMVPICSVKLSPGRRTVNVNIAKATRKTTGSCKEK